MVALPKALIFWKREKSINELFDDLKSALENLIKLCNNGTIPEEIREYLSSFCREKINELNQYKNRYPKINLLVFRRWFGVVEADLSETEELFELMDDEKNKRSCFAAIELISEAIDAIDENIPPVRKVA